MFKYILLGLLFVSSVVYAEPRVRPDIWGAPIIGVNLSNLYMVDKGVYRSEQPKRKDVNSLLSLDIKEVLNLRELHDDKKYMTGSGLVLHRVKMNTNNVTEKQIIDSLRIINNRKGSILIHCWHGSDRTGITIAAYRIIYNNWTKPQALDEMINGGYGYHSSIYPDLVTLIEDLNVAKIKKALNMDVIQHNTAND